LKTEYVAVTGSAHPVALSKFNNYLISIGEPTTSRSWTLESVVKHTKKVLKEYKKTCELEHCQNVNLFLDSGGYQIITNDIKKSRYEEFIHVYHYIFKKFKNDFSYIFSLDINWPGRLTAEELYNFNLKSITESLDAIDKHPELSDKQLFVWQTRNPFVYDTWTKIYDELKDRMKIYNRWAFGGLVGFKAVSGAKFLPFIPSFMDFMTKVKRDNLKVDHVHFLGQSSFLAIMTAAILQRIYNIELITLDSSELVRASKIEQKMPLFIKEKWIRDTEKLEHVLDEKEFEYLIKTGRMHNASVFIKVMSSHIDEIVQFANKHAEEIWSDYNKLHSDSFLDKWSQFDRGRLYQEFRNGLDLVKEWMPIVDSGDVDTSSKKYRDEILAQYKSF